MKQALNLKLVASLVLAALAVTLGGLSAWRKIQGFQPLGFDPRPRGAVVEVDGRVDPSTGLRPRDEIHLADAAETGSPAQLAQRLRQKETSRLVVLRGEQLVDVTYRRPAFDADWAYLIMALIGAAYLGIGLFTLARLSADTAGRGGFLFYLWCLTSAALYLLSPATPLDGTFRLVYFGDLVARLLLPALTLHLFAVFPETRETPETDRRGRHSRPALRRFVPFFYLPAAILLALEGNQVFAVFGPRTREAIALLDRLGTWHFILLSLAAAGVLFRRLARERRWEESRQLRWMALGVAGGYLPFLLLYVLPWSLDWRWSEAVTASAVLPLALVPLTFAWAILRYKLWDIEVLVRDTISGTLTILLGVIGFSLVNVAISRGVAEELTLARNLLTFVAGLGIAGLLLPTRSALSSVLERVYYGEAFERRRALRTVGRELLEERDLGRLCSTLLSEVEAAVGLEQANLFLLRGATLYGFRPEPGLLPPLAAADLPAELWSKDYLRLGSAVVLPGEELPLTTLLFAAGYRAAFPLAVRGKPVGLLVAGGKRDKRPLSSEDGALIRQLLSQAALAIENAQLMGQLHLQLEEVRRLQCYSEEIFESSPAGIAVVDGERRIVSANAAFAELVGLSRQEVCGRGLEAVLPVDPLPSPGEGPIEVAWCDAPNPDTPATPANTERYLQLSLAVFEPGSGEGRYVLVAHDVSERVAMENALREQDRLAALGMLAAGVAHEVNTPITGISSYAQMLLAETPPSDPRYETLKKVERQTFRAARIVNNLLEFARNRPKEKKPVALAPLLTETLDLLAERRVRRQIALDWQAPRETIQVLGCDGELQQVFTNLLVNALDAMSALNETGGRLTVTLEAPETAGTAAPSDADTVAVRVADTGPGIAPDKLELIFQPFYSTKLNRGGTGLGLAISHEIVRRHGGELTAESRPGEGACFTVRLPRYLPGRPERSAAAPA